MATFAFVIPLQWCNGAKANNMLAQFTWQQFLVATLVLTLIWYSSIILLFYRKELNSILGGKAIPKKPSEPLPHRWDETVDILEEEKENLLGKPKLPDGVSTENVGNIHFSNDVIKSQQVGLIPDILEDIKEIFKEISSTDGNKKDFFKMMQSVTANYPPMGSHPHLHHINLFISENAPFHLSAEELENLWD